MAIVLNYWKVLALKILLTGRETSVFYFSWGKSCEQEKKNSEGVWLACSAGVFFGRASVFARESFMMAATTIRTRTRFRPPIGVFPALLLRAALHYPNAWNALCQHGPRGVGLLNHLTTNALEVILRQTVNTNISYRHLKIFST